MGISTLAPLCVLLDAVMVGFVWSMVDMIEVSISCCLNDGGGLVYV